MHSHIQTYMHMHADNLVTENASVSDCCTKHVVQRLYKSKRKTLQHHTSANAQVCTHTRRHARAHAHSPARMGIRKSTHTHIRIRKRARTHMHMHISVHTYARGTYTCTQAYMLLHTHTHANMQRPISRTQLCQTVAPHMLSKVFARASMIHVKKYIGKQIY